MSAPTVMSRVRRAGTTPGARRARRNQSWRGALYALPNALCVIGLFILPLLLVVQMSGSKWPLLSGNQGWNLPANYVKAVSHRLFVDSVVFTVK